LDDLTQRELFCRNFGGHWCGERDRFFRFPAPPTPSLEHNDAADIQWGRYDSTPIGRAKFLKKLEEAAILHFAKEGMRASATQELANTAFMNRMNRIIVDWVEDLECAMVGVFMDESVVDKYVQRVEAAMRALSNDEEDLSPARDRKRRREEGDEFSPETRRQMQRIDDEAAIEIEAGPCRSSRNRLFSPPVRAPKDAGRSASSTSSETSSDS